MEERIQSKKRERKANFTEDETLTLIEEVSKEKATLLGQYSPTLTMQKKNEIWDCICFKLNAMFGNDRRSHELKKKWKDLKAVARQKKPPPKGVGAGNSHKDSIFSAYVLDILNSFPSATNGSDDVSALTGSVQSDHKYTNASIIGAHTITTNENGYHNDSDMKETRVDDEPNQTAQLEVLVKNEEQARQKVARPPISPYTTDYKSRRRQERESLWKLKTLRVQKKELKLKLLKSKIAKNNSIAELNQVKKEYFQAKTAKLEIDRLEWCSDV